MSKSTIEQVAEFHQKFNHPILNTPLFHNGLSALRIKLLQEELEELAHALYVKDQVETLDALCDLQYVLDGAFLSLGYHKVKDEAFTEVHASNMSKLGLDGKPIYAENGKILKGPNYRGPSLKQFIDKLNQPFMNDVNKAFVDVVNNIK